MGESVFLCVRSGEQRGRVRAQQGALGSVTPRQYKRGYARKRSKKKEKSEGKRGQMWKHNIRNGNDEHRTRKRETLIDSYSFVSPAAPHGTKR
jgi:hypothetical protein